jgi:hypothetical protein
MLATEEMLVLGLFAKFIAIVFVLPVSALFSALYAISCDYKSNVIAQFVSMLSLAHAPLIGFANISYFLIDKRMPNQQYLIPLMIGLTILGLSQLEFRKPRKSY